MQPIKITRPQFPKGYVEHPTSSVTWAYVVQRLSESQDYWLCSVRPSSHVGASSSRESFIMTAVLKRAMRRTSLFRPATLLNERELISKHSKPRASSNSNSGIQYTPVLSIAMV